MRPSRSFESFGFGRVRIFSEQTRASTMAMNKGFSPVSRRRHRVLNLDDTFHIPVFLQNIAAAMGGCDIVYGDLNMGPNHSTKYSRPIVAGRTFKRYGSSSAGYRPTTNF